ncbi:aldose 1-epimerase [Cohnella abietis]|uniref:Galactose mutarotase n=1 Tax=Cohnella abietis TaxID=2507935 RepID=A0A3T1DA00_9BACL|nr:aldose 1-epimerase [Cohnella abietis]BBI34899.1 galactose mutarotase [Cohnella abietis]
MTLHYAKQGTYENEPAILLKHGSYSAILLPRIGGNLISFRDDDRDFRFIREPEGADWEAFVEKPIVHGIPVLFPPNRYDGGVFEFDGRTYRFPINEEETGNHIHGFISQSEWEVVSLNSSEQESSVTVKLIFDEKHAGYVYFPHQIVFSQTFTLSNRGLEHRFEALNESDVAIPFMLGFHTSLNAPFASGSSKDDLECGISIGERWELNERMLPTGDQLALSEGELLLKEGKGSPYCASFDNHYTSSGVGVNETTIYDRRLNVRFVYEAGEAYKHWMVYNAEANGKFFCPEPQTGMVNAPNLKLPEEITGLIRLEPSQQWAAGSRMYVQ